MNEIKINFQILKAVKKNTYNGIINQAKLNINPENAPIQKMSVPRSQSFKKIPNFVPKLKPKKSAFIPAPLKLNNLSPCHKKKKEDDFNKQNSDDEIEIISNSDSSLSSSDMENSFIEDTDKKINKDDLILQNCSTNFIEDLELKDKDDGCDSFQLNEIKEVNENDEDNVEMNKNMKLLRKKMAQIKARTGINKFKETEEFIHEKFKKNFNIGLKNNEKEGKLKDNLHISINIFEKKKPKSKSIFEVLSVSKKSKKSKF